MKRFLITATICLLAVGSASAQQVYKIYPGTAPGEENSNYKEFTLPNAQSQRPLVYNVTEPTITVYKPEASIDTGAAMIIAPGGGNMYLTWEEEGINVAQWFQRHGVTGIILKYRTNFMGNSEKEIQDGVSAALGRMFSSFADMGKAATEEKSTIKKEIPMPVIAAPTVPQATKQGDDGRQAVKYVREHAKELGINPQKIGLMGFSAGAMLTSNVMAIHDKNSRPDLAAPIYGAQNFKITDDTMPVFICGPEFDLFTPDASFGLYWQYQQSHLPAELHFINDATHGEGLLYNGKQWNDWIEILFSFMKAVKFVE